MSRPGPPASPKRLAPRTLAASVALLVGAAACAATVVGVADTGRAGLVTFGLLMVLGAGAVGVAHGAAARRPLLGGLRRQFTLAVALAVGQLLIAVIAVVALMFVSGHDALLIVVIVGFAGVIAVRAAQLFAGGVMEDVEALRDGLEAVGAGARSVAISTGGRDELAELAEQANATLRRLAAEESARDDADRARRDLVAAASHDLRTPITSLRLIAEALSDDLVDDETRRRYLNTMGTHIRALSGLIDDLFELSRLEAGEVEWSMERVALAELVGETVAAMQPDGRAKGVALVGEVAPELGAARADPEKVQRVLFNLIQNAIRHTPADGSVTVRAIEGSEGPEVEVVDTGDGIVAGERGRVFEPFYRGGAGEASRPPDGAGLGLAIARAIVEAHGGRIWLDAAAAGTSVRFNLPPAS